MASFFQALGKLAEDYGNAKLRKQQQDREQSVLAHNQAVQDIYTRLASQREQRLAQEDTLRKQQYQNELQDIGLPTFTADGKTYRQMWSPSQGKVIKIESGGADDAMGALRDIVQQDPRFKDQLGPFAASSLKAHGGDAKSALRDVLEERNRLRSEIEKREDASQRERDRQQDYSQHLADRREDAAQREKDRREEEKQRLEDRKSFKDYVSASTDKRKLNSQEQGLLDLTKQIEPKLDQLQKILEDNKLTDKGGILDVAKAQKNFREYQIGLKPDDVSSSIIKAAAALQVMGAAPWMKMGRGKYLFETIKQHLPSPTDSPALLYDKVQFLRSIVDEAKQSLPNQDDPLGVMK